jgi:phosphoribosylanthranilate isomerase
VWVKICGNRRLEDCLAAAELGADAVGFVFVPGGKRTVTASQVAAITVHLPVELEKIGVFAGQSLDAVIAAVDEAGLTGVQLHLGGPDALSVKLREHFGTRVRIINATHWWTDFTAKEQGSGFAESLRAITAQGSADAVLADTKTRDASGGTGRTFDWSGAAPYLRDVTLPFIAAGGLRPENVADAVCVLRPWGVDVSSGVEAGTPGVKDRDAIARFIANARAAADRV